MNGELVPLTVNLTSEAAAALERAAERDELSRTDVVNLAVLAYDQLSSAPTTAAFRLPREPRRSVS